MHRPSPAPQAATKSFVLYLANAASSAPPPRTLAALLSPAVAAKTRGFKPDTTPVCPPLPDGSKTNYCWSLNWNIFELPKTPALFPKSTPGPTTYTLEVTQGDVIDIVLVNPTRMVHPQHLHGAGFWVLAAGNGEAVGADGKLVPGIKLNLRDPPVKDTIAVPQSVGDAPSGWGYAVIRFRADNPGAWAFHCHIDLHAASGMFSVIAVRPPKGAKWFAPSGAACGAAP
jgi:FtsP/CotA-like multicopper oxidase with cupredoxin domain